MPTREEYEEQPVFRPHSRSGSIAPRDDSPASQAQREPISTQEREGSDVMAPYEHPGAESGTRRKPIEELVARIIIHEERPIENLPAMAAPELKLTGRCVSLCVKQSIDGGTPAPYYYTGLVAMVTATTVTLMHVNRYTRADFKEYKSREQRLVKGRPAVVNLQYADHSPPRHQRATPRSPFTIQTAPRGSSAVTSPTQPGQSLYGGLSVHGYSADGEVGVGEDGELTSTEDSTRLCALNPAGGLAPAVPLTAMAEDSSAVAHHQDQAERLSRPDELSADVGADGTTAAHRVMGIRRFRTFDGSFGPIPYVTFLRKSIHEVEFGRDPRSSFYSLFQDPAKHIGDMQHLRMFVRRYLVHTSEGNNPRQVPLYAYLSARCAWPSVDRELVSRLVHEELVGLLKTDRAIEKEKKRTRIREQQRVQAVRQYRAPSGLFSNTGILYLTSIPQSTFIAAAFIMLLTVAFAIYLSVMMSTTRDTLIITFAQGFVMFFAAAIIVWGIAGIANILHAIVVHVPLRRNLVRMVLHVVFTIGSLACCIMCIMIALSRMTNRAIYDHMATHQPYELCAFYERYNCSGFFRGCGLSNNSFDPNVCSTCPGVNDSKTGCYYALWGQVQMTTLPLLVFTIFIMIAVLYALFLIAKLLMTTKAISGSFF
ncbi:hypothetical protein LSCM1_01377 [Leishmania martiniquensis]|uniref:Uncharacterized protein n=1 Tax=Leishmania martiniquensis TaxID=1580590 RepID=A0A836GSZ7_9TRYP|nr:hypothetical protein LSCM1_01377 [Leishmania martiniquensis]